MKTYTFLLTGGAVLFLAMGIAQSKSLSDVMGIIVFTIFIAAIVMVRTFLLPLLPKRTAYREHEGDGFVGALLFALLWGGLLPGAVILGFWVTR